MDINNKLEERRRFPRYGISEDSYAALGPESGKIGQIINLSKGGASIRYVSGPANKLINEEFVFLGCSGHYLDKLTCRVVRDYPVEGNLYFSSREIRHCGIEFVNLKEKHKAELTNFLNANKAKST